MKKYLLIILAAIFGMLLSSCVEKEIITYHPGDLVAPVMSDLSQAEYVLVADGAFDSFNFTEASIGMSAAIQYEVFAVLTGDGATPKSLGKGTNIKTLTVDANTLNSVLISLKCEADKPVVLNFFVTANWMSQSNKPVGVAATSNVISATVTPFYSERTYPKVYVIGTYNAWKHEDDTYLYNYAEDDKVYEGVIDFAYFGKDIATNDFKITGVTNWDNADLNWGVTEKNPEPADPVTLQLISGSSSQDIQNYRSFRYYYFKFNKSTLLLSKEYGFNQMGVIGLNGDWDNDIEMTWNPWKSRWYVDIEVPAATTLKFRLDGDWNAGNWGGSEGVCVKGGDNIPVESGNYRVYFYMNQLTYTFDADMYGKEEPGKDVPPAPEVKYWSLIGELGTDDTKYWAEDVNMTESPENVFTAVATINGMFKLRYGADWGINRGAEGDVEPVEVTLDTPINVVEGGKNFKVPAAGLYKVVYDSLAANITVSNMANKWSVIGEIEGGTDWNTDFFMTEKEGKWVSDAIVIKGGFKVRYNASWDDANTRGAGSADFKFTVGEPFDVVAPGANINLPEGAVEGAEYVVTYDPTAEKITINLARLENQWALIGGIEGGDWETDINMRELSTGTWVSDPVVITGEFKIRYNGAWDTPAGENRGGTLVNLGERFSVNYGGPNISVPEVGKKYQVYYYPAFDEVMVVAAEDSWGLIGYLDWNHDMIMAKITTTNGTIWASDVIYVEETTEFKIRKSGDYAKGDKGGTFSAIGEPIALTDGGGNIKIGTAGYYMVTYLEADNTIVISYAWGVVGNVNGTNWDKDFFMKKISKDEYVSPAFVADGGFKIRAGGTWDTKIDRGGSFSALDTPFAVTNGGANIEVPIDSKYTVLYNAANETITVSAVAE